MLYQFITYKHLDLNPNLLNQPIFDIVISELQKIDLYRSPADLVQLLLEQLDCMVESCRLLELMFRFNKSNMRGADDFLPSFIYSLLKSKLRSIRTTIEFIEKYRYKNSLKSEYYFY